MWLLLLTLNMRLCARNKAIRDRTITAQKMKFPIKDFLSKCDQMRSLLRIWSHLLKKSLMENFIFCAVNLSRFEDSFLSSLLTLNMDFSVVNIEVLCQLLTGATYSTLTKRTPERCYFTSTLTL